jgi:hypothetical protein
MMNLSWLGGKCRVPRSLGCQRRVSRVDVRAPGTMEIRG